jgi:hypothetical protein
MNFPEINSAIKHLIKTCKCLQCQAKYKSENISIVATTKLEGLFELHCDKCKATSIVSILLTPEHEEGTAREMEITPQRRNFKGISQDDVLDIKNFLSTFDGNFKKIFSKKK